MGISGGFFWQRVPIMVVLAGNTVAVPQSEIPLTLMAVMVRELIGLREEGLWHVSFLFWCHPTGPPV